MATSRALGQTSRLGAFLDPVADKLIVAVALVLLVSKDPRLDAWSLTGHASSSAARSRSRRCASGWPRSASARKVAVSQLGKFKTILQMVGLSMMLFRWDLFGLPIYQLGLVLTVLAAVLTLWSMVDYLRAAWPVLGARPGAGFLAANSRQRLLDLTRRGNPTICAPLRCGNSSVGRAQPCQG